MIEKQFFRQGAQGCFTAAAIILLAISTLWISTSYMYPEHRSCGGMLGAGYPVLFICDDWAGSSPTNSWGRITFVDIPNGGIRPTGFLIDFLFYLILIWMVWFVIVGLLYKRVSRYHLWWATFISFGFVVGFLCAFLTFQSSRLYVRESEYYKPPIPILPSATPLGTLPSVITPIPTSAP